MSRPTSKIGSRHGWSLAAIALTSLASVSSADEGAIERCREAASADERIACLEAALSAADESPADKVVDQQSAMTAPASVPSLPGPADDDVATTEESDAALSTSSDAMPTTPQSTPVADAAAEARDAVKPVQPPLQSEKALGAEQIRSRAEAEAELAFESSLAVAGYTHFPHMRLEVRLANGQVWRQIKGDTQEVRATLRKNQTVDIEQSSLGGYKLRLNEMRRTIRVRRIK